MKNVCGLEGKPSVSHNLGQIRFKKHTKSQYDVTSYTADRHMLTLFLHTAKKNAIITGNACLDRLSTYLVTNQV